MHSGTDRVGCGYALGPEEDFDSGLQDEETNENYQSTFKHWDDNKNTSDKPTSQNAKLGKNCEYHTPDYSKWSGVSTIDFPMHWNFQYARDAFNVAVGNDRFYNDASYNVMYVDSHDYGPDGIEKVRYNMGTNAWKENMSLMFTFRGVPCIYYGSEVEFQKGKTIDEGPNIALKDSGRAYFGNLVFIKLVALLKTHLIQHCLNI